MRLPSDIQRLFYRYRTVRPCNGSTHESLIIEKVLEDGAVNDWRWLFQAYGMERIRARTRDSARAAQLSSRVEWSWTLVLLHKPHETPR
ncbi:hypothetical protein [Ferrimicrobium sp.]|uniref:DUF6922 domain-containing protein n=1 Tax=Ferrimicrobium sp. TaxID=2926050 RepID=UPI0035A6F98C